MGRMADGNVKHLRAIIQTQTEIAASDLDLDAVMELIARRAQDLTRGSGGAIEIADGDEMVYRVTTGEATPFLGVRLKMDASLSGLCVREDKVLRCDDTATDPRVDNEACRRVNAQSMICVPLVHREETVGVLKVYAPRVNNFDDSDGETLELLSELVAAHMSHASLFAAEVHGGRHDALTGMLNRRAYEERLPVEMPAPPDTPGRSRSACSTSTASRGSTTPSATPRATERCNRSRRCSTSRDSPTTASASAATSSRS